MSFTVVVAESFLHLKLIQGRVVAFGRYVDRPHQVGEQYGNYSKVVHPYDRTSNEEAGLGIVRDDDQDGH